MAACDRAGDRDTLRGAASHRAAQRAVPVTGGRPASPRRSDRRHRTVLLAGRPGRRYPHPDQHLHPRQRHRRRGIHRSHIRSGAAMKAPSLTIGIAEEYQIIDPETRELKSYITEILQEDSVVLGEIKPELHQSMVEVATTICQTPAELRNELIRLRRTVMDLAARRGLVIAAAGTHPYSSWLDQEITPLGRYIGVKEDLQELAQSLLIFGTHVHIGIEDPEFRIDAMNVCRYFMPHVLAMSTSSPFWMGRNTGLKSYRSIIFRSFPRTGIPRRMTSWADYNQFVEVMVATGSIPDASKLWWDVRPHHKFPTLEFRICDVCT